MQQKMNVASKKIQSDEIKNTESSMRDNFIKRVQ